MRFLTDIPFGKAVQEFLRTQGHDVLSVAEGLSPQATDPQIVEFAIDQQRCILCFDLGFGGLVALSGEQQPSVITFRINRHTSSAIIGILEDVLPIIEPHVTRGSLITIEPNRIRVRLLPI